MIKEVLKRNKRINRVIGKYSTKYKIMQVQKNGICELDKITTLLNGKGIFSFADFGTLLGIMRDGQLLKHDSDLDVGVIMESEVTIVEVDEVFRSLGYKLIREFTIEGSIKERSYMKHHLKVDIQIYFKDTDADSMFCYLFYHKSDNSQERYWKTVIKRCPRVKKLKQIEIGAHKVFVPENAEAVLQNKYGDRWKVPDKSWVYWEGPNTIKVDDIGVLELF